MSKLGTVSRWSFLTAETEALRLASRPSACHEVLDRCGFGAAGLIDWMDQRNPSRDAPYHNATHEACVVVAAYEGACFEGLRRHELDALMIAAAFHDFNHTAGREPDHVNIARALNGLDQYFEENTTDDEVMDLARKLIEVTEYPFIRAPRTLTEAIIRDADLMMPYQDEQLRLALFTGLREELATAGKTFTTEEYATGLAEFYSKQPWHTNWAKRRAELYHWPVVLKDLKDDFLRQA